MSSFLVMNVVVAIVLNQFEDELDREKRMAEQIVTKDHIQQFGRLWVRYTPQYTMQVSKLSQFLKHLPAPLGRREPNVEMSGIDVLHFLDELAIPSDYNHVHYLDVLHQHAILVFK